MCALVSQKDSERVRRVRYRPERDRATCFYCVSSHREPGVSQSAHINPGHAHWAPESESESEEVLFSSMKETTDEGESVEF